jgi:hypothetical protein
MNRGDWISRVGVGRLDSTLQSEIENLPLAEPGQSAAGNAPDDSRAGEEDWPWLSTAIASTRARDRRVPTCLFCRG